DGRRLAKRHGDTRLSALRDAGVTAEALVGLLAWSCGWQESAAPVTPRELLPRFRLGAIPRRPFVLTRELLRGIGHRFTASPRRGYAPPLGSRSGSVGADLPPDVWVCRSMMPSGGIAYSSSTDWPGSAGSGSTAQCWASPVVCRPA